jgi:hypothetical protein
LPAAISEQEGEDGMRLGLILAATFALAMPLYAAEHDVDWFVKNPKQRAVPSRVW